MVMVADLLPGLKGVAKRIPLKPTALRLLKRVVVAFVLHSGRMSCLGAAGAIKSEPVHRAQISRFMARPRWRRVDLHAILIQDLLRRERGGEYIFIFDATLSSQTGKKTENVFSTGNRQRRPRKNRRFGQQKHTRKNCHSFTCGLLITPSGVRIPFSKPYYTREYAKQKGRKHVTTAEAAAALIRELPLPDEVG